MKYVYLDNAASSPPARHLLDEYSRLLLRYYGNSESVHAAGKESKELQDESARLLARTITGNEKNAFVQWTCSGTESANTALSLPRFKKGVIVTTQAEHPSILAAAGRTGAEIRFAAISSDGGIDMESLAGLLDSSVNLVALHHVQSETGRLQDIKAVSQIIREKAPRAVFLLDTIQSLCKIPVSVGGDGPGIILLSGYKIGSPAGGAVICAPAFADEFRKLRSEAHLVPRVPAAMTAILARQVEELYEEKDAILARVSGIAAQLRNSLETLDFECTPTVPVEKASPFIVHARFPGHEGAVLARMLSARGVIVSAGSACSAESGGPSRALTAMGLSEKDAYSALRISLWTQNTQPDIDQFITALKESLKDY
ncbi:MAG: hypothetical protein A2020_12520 [Lentisphaerae bacterium GWF2_45_14]|nr:MAG: hypothetical protein A2020_12520 [Lentisphaerae bacterium GWF2_45_14]